MNAGLMSMTGHERAAARWLTVSAVLTVAFGVAMVPRLGMVGAALAYVNAMLVWNVAFWWIVKRRVGVDSSILAIFQPGALDGLRSLRRTSRGHA
jgi:O-antigen/teichoic acid export membrane protein